MNSKQRRARVQGGWAPPNNVKSDKDKLKPQAVPIWYGKNIDQPVTEKKFVYEETSEVCYEYALVLFINVLKAVPKLLPIHS